MAEHSSNLFSASLGSLGGERGFKPKFVLMTALLRTANLSLFFFSLFNGDLPFSSAPFQSFYSQLCRIKYKISSREWLFGLKNKSLPKKPQVVSGLLLGFPLKDHCPVHTARLFGNGVDKRTHFRT